MIIKICLLFLSVLNGGWMVFEGMHVIRKGKYFGPEKPGPWSKIVSSIGLDPFSIGPFFVLLGITWFVSIAGLLMSATWGWYALLASAIATLWYIKVGTAISAVVIVLLVIFKIQLGYS